MAELFDRFEVDRVPRWPLMSRLVALSLVAHGLFLVAVVYVPSLRNLLRVAGSVSGIEFVSEDYDRTLLGQRATIVKLTEPYEKLYYPTDYFGAPPDPLADPMLMAQTAPPPPPVVIKPPRQRQQQATIIATPTPTPSPEEVAAASPTPTPDAQQQAGEAELNRVAERYGVQRPQVNSEPFEDLAKKGKEMYDAGQLNVNSLVDVTATAERNADGTFKPESVDIKWGTTQDPAMAELAQHLVTALSQSKVLGLLKGGPAVQMGLKLDQQNVSVRIVNEFPTEESAGQQVEGYSLLLAAARLTKNGTDEGELYKNLKISREGKQFVLTFEMPKETAGKMIVEMLARKAAKEKEAAGATPANGKG